jgi:O-antigen ligase
MTPHVATIVFAIGVLGLFLLDREPQTRTSKGLWIPVLWLLINGSRPVGTWLQSGATEKMLNPDQYLDGSPFDRFVYSGLLAAGLIVLAGRRELIARLLRRNAPIVLFFAYCALSVVWSDYPYVAFKRWIKDLSDLVMVLIVLTDSDPFAALKRLVARVGFILVPASVLFIKYYPALGRIYNIWTWEPMYVGVTDHKNTLGMVCLILGLGFEWRLLLAYRDRGDPHRIRRLMAYGSLIAMVVWLLLTANSATSLYCFLLGSSLMVATSLGGVMRKPALVHLLVGSIVSVAMFALLFDAGGSLVGAMGRDPTLTGRTDIWKLVLSMSENPLVGSGFESFWLGDRAARIWRSYYFHPNQAHNGYIEVYLELGWIGIIMLTAIIVIGYRNALGTFRLAPDAGRIRLAYIAVGLIYDLTEAGFRMTSLTWFFFLISTVVVPKPVVEQDSSALADDISRNFIHRLAATKRLSLGFRKETT